MWQGAEPTRGIYNCTYFCVIHGIIQSLAKRNIYTLIDVHQDVLARQFCQEGVPDVGLLNYKIKITSTYVKQLIFPILGSVVCTEGLDCKRISTLSIPTSSSVHYR